MHYSPKFLHYVGVYNNLMMIFCYRWGAYPKCDSPSILIENMLKHIALQHPVSISYIY